MDLPIGEVDGVPAQGHQLDRTQTVSVRFEQTPLIADSFERVRPAIGELDSRAGYEVPDRARHQHFVRVRR